MNKVVAVSVSFVLSLFIVNVGFTQASPTLVAEFDNDTQGWRTNEHAIELMWAPEDAGDGMGSISCFIDPDQPDDDSPEGKIEGDLPDGINIADYEYASFYYKCDSEAYTGSNIFLMPMLEGGAGGGGSHHGGSMIGDNEWHYQEFHVSEFALWWGDWTWENTKTLVIGFTETNERGFCEIWIDHVMLHNSEGDGVILASGGVPQVLSTIPGAGEEVAQLKEVTFTFDQVVEGVATDGSDLLVDGVPAEAVTTSNNRSFVFTGFPALSGDTVSIELQPGEIKSLTGDAFEGYSYSLNVYEYASYEAPYAVSAPALDGVIEEGEYSGEWISDWTANLGGQDAESDADWSAEWTATHDNDYLYAAFRVQDDVRETAADPYAADNVEFFIDGPNLKDGTGIQFRANWDGSAWVSSVDENWEFTVGDTGSEWIVEARFPKSTLEIPAEGAIGFNLQPSDNDDGTRGLYYFWTDSPNNNNPWDDAASWGNMVLLSGSVNVPEWSLY